LSLRNRVWSAAEAPLTPTICGSPSPAQWDARSATNSRCPMQNASQGQPSLWRRGRLVGSTSH
jgi:hypothetical protein